MNQDDKKQTEPRKLVQRDEGRRFSQVYLDRSTPTQDSKRMRVRLSAAFYVHAPDGLAGLLHRELGVDVPHGYERTNWRAFFDHCELRDVLDAITLTYSAIVNGRFTSKNDADHFRQNVQRIFDEENVHYQLDASAGVHFRVDEEFARSGSATIAALQTARYANSLDAFERGLACLTELPPDGKNAVRGVFTAMEGLFRLKFPNSPRLTGKEADRLKPLIDAAFAGDKPALAASAKMLESLRDWIDAAHNYRHEAGTEEVAQPPLQVAVYMVSVGAAHLRWLAELDAKTNKP